MKALLLFLFASLFPVYVWSVENLRFPDIRSSGLGGNEVTQSLLYNPSLVALLTSKEVRIECFNRYQMKELMWLSACFAYPNKGLPVGVDISSFGYDAWRESRFRLFLGKSLNQKWALGIAVQYYMLQTELQDHFISSLSTDLGVTYSPVDNLFIGMLIKDLPSVTLDKNKTENKFFNDYLLQLGFQWKIINSMLIAASLGTKSEYALTACLGVEYTAFDSFHIRVGIQTAPLLPSLGIGYDFAHFSVNIASIYHSILGISSGLGISYRF